MFHFFCLPLLLLWWFLLCAPKFSLTNSKRNLTLDLRTRRWTTTLKSAMKSSKLQELLESRELEFRLIVASELLWLSWTLFWRTVANVQNIFVLVVKRRDSFLSDWLLLWRPRGRQLVTWETKLPVAQKLVGGSVWISPRSCLRLQNLFKGVIAWKLQCC